MGKYSTTHYEDCPFMGEELSPSEPHISENNIIGKKQENQYFSHSMNLGIRGRERPGEKGNLALKL